MTRQETFEQHYAEQHDLPASTMAQYRFTSQDGYRLPSIAAAYRNYCAGWEESSKQKNATITQEFNRCMVCYKFGGHGGLPCPEMTSMRLAGTIVPKEIQISISKGKDHEQ